MSVTAAAAIDDACVLTQGDVDRHTHRGRERRPARRGTAEVAAAPAAKRTSVGSGPCDAFCPVASGPGHARWLFGATRQGAWFRQRRKPMALLTSMRGGRAGRRGGPPGKGAASARLRAACRASTGRHPRCLTPCPAVRRLSGNKSSRCRCNQNGYAAGHSPDSPGVSLGTAHGWSRDTRAPGCSRPLSSAGTEAPVRPASRGRELCVAPARAAGAFVE